MSLTWGIQLSLPYTLGAKLKQHTQITGHAQLNEIYMTWWEGGGWVGIQCF